MGAPSSDWIDRRITNALDLAFYQIDRYQRDGYCTEDDVVQALNRWGDGVADFWREYVEDNS